MPPRNYYQSKKSTSRSAGANQGFNQFSRKSGSANITPKPVKQTKSSFSFFPLIDAANKIIKSIPPIKVRPAKLPSTKPRGTKIVTTPTKDGKSKILTTPSPKGGSKIVTQNTVKRTYKNPYSGYTRPQSEAFLKNTPKRNKAAKTSVRSTLLGPAQNKGTDQKSYYKSDTIKLKANPPTKDFKAKKAVSAVLDFYRRNPKQKKKKKNNHPGFI